MPQEFPTLQALADRINFMVQHKYETEQALRAQQFNLASMREQSRLIEERQKALAKYTAGLEESPEEKHRRRMEELSYERGTRYGVAERGRAPIPPKEESYDDIFDKWLSWQSELDKAIGAGDPTSALRRGINILELQLKGKDPERYRQEFKNLSHPPTRAIGFAPEWMTPWAQQRGQAIGMYEGAGAPGPMGAMGLDFQQMYQPTPASSTLRAQPSEEETINALLRQYGRK